MLSRYFPYLAGAFACTLFIFLGLLLLPYPGAHYDEVLFVMSIHNPDYVEYAMKFSFGKVPIMLMTYIGTLKAAIYYPILKYVGAGNYTLRVPTLLITAGSIWFFFLTLRRLAGNWTAFLLAMLLATDVMYLLTAVFDWGPVALQHLLFTAAVYCFVRFTQDPRRRWLFLGAFTAGLALWDKALFIWTLAGFGVAMLVVIPVALWRLARDRRSLAVLTLGFVLGALPFLYYNKIHKLRTFTANTEVDEEKAATKLIALDRTFDGSGLMGYMVRESPEGPLQPVKTWEKIPLFLNDKLGNPRNSFQHILLVGCLLLVPFACWAGPNRRVALLFLLGGVATLLLMIFTRRAGGSIHHTVLLWPIPQFLAALAAGELIRRWPRRGLRVAVVAVGICVASNLTVINTYLAHFIACGPSWIWTDAIRPLVSELGSKPGRLVFAVDWGVLQQVDYYGNGKIGSHRNSDGIVTGLPDPVSAEPLGRILADPATLFVTHVEGIEAFPGVRRKMIDFASERGYQDHLVKTICDRHGAPIFEIHEFRK
jgi:hypothetical protein